MSAQEQQPDQIKQKRVKKTIPTCGICVEPFNKSTRQPINCPYCIFEACKICCETYILNETTVKCMNPECSKPWNRKQIRERFTLVFINGTLREHYEKVLFDKERALLPATQPIVEAKIQAKNIQKEIKEMLDIQLHDNIKARVLNNEQNNQYVNPRNTKKIRSQVEIYNYLYKKRGKQLVPDFYLP